MTVEDRLRATAEALSGSMREVRPLTLPPERPGRVSPPREPRRWPGRLVPLTAAVTVISVAVTLVAVRDGRGASPAPPAPANPSASTIPRYYVQLGAADNSAPGYQRDAIVGDSLTGKVLAAVKPPARLTFEGVTGAADDRTFVIDATPVVVSTQPDHTPQGTHTWYLLRLNPGTPHPATLTRLPITAPADSVQIDGMALAPDAATLAVLYQIGALGGGLGPYALQTFSLTTGKALRTWTAPQGRVGVENDNQLDLTWTADGRTLAFVFPPYDRPEYERTLNVNRKGTNLAADSRLVLAIQGNQHNCVSMLLAADGRTTVCAELGNATGECRQQEPVFNLYSTATGKLSRVLYRYRGCQSAFASLAWAGVGGTAIGVIGVDHDIRGRITFDFTVGLLTPGKFTPLHVSVPSGYGFDTGSLAF